MASKSEPSAGARAAGGRDASPPRARRLPPDEQRRLDAVMSYGLVDRPADPHLTGITRLAAIVCEAENAAVNLIGDREQHPVATTRQQRAPTPRSASYCSIAMHEQGPVVVSDARLDDRFADLPTTTGELGNIRSYAGVPLRSEEGERLGMLCVFGDRVRDFSPTQLEALELLAGQVMEVFEARRQASRLIEAEQRFRVAFHRTPVGMVMVDPDLELIEANGAFAALVGRRTDASLTDLLHPDDRLQIVEEAASLLDGRSSTYRAEHRLLGDDGTWIWTELWCSAVSDAEGRPTHLVVQVEDISARRQQLAAVTHEAVHDALTGLPNRVLLEDRLLQALDRIERGGEVVVLAVDLDGFKQVNDAHGHAAGDRVLLEVTARLLQAVRAGDTVCRWGGDEFIVVCEDFAGSGVARDVAQRIVLAAAQPIDLDGASVRIGASIGAVATSDHSIPVDELLRRADDNLYRAKRRGRGRVEFTEESEASGGRRPDRGGPGA